MRSVCRPSVPRVCMCLCVNVRACVLCSPTRAYSRTRTHVPAETFPILASMAVAGADGDDVEEEDAMAVDAEGEEGGGGSSHGSVAGGSRGGEEESEGTSVRECERAGRPTLAAVAYARVHSLTSHTHAHGPVEEGATSASEGEEASMASGSSSSAGGGASGSEGESGEDDELAKLPVRFFFCGCSVCV